MLVLLMGQSLLFLVPIVDISVDFGGGLSLPTLAFTLLIVVAATLLSGTVPALFTARSGLNETFKEGGRSGGAVPAPTGCAVCWWSPRWPWQW